MHDHPTSTPRLVTAVLARRLRWSDNGSIDLVEVMPALQVYSDPDRPGAYGFTVWAVAWFDFRGCDEGVPHYAGYTLAVPGKNGLHVIDNYPRHLVPTAPMTFPTRFEMDLQVADAFGLTIAHRVAGGVVFDSEGVYRCEVTVSNEELVTLLFPVHYTD